MVMRLARGERCVTELAAEVGLSQSCTTRHLQALQKEGIVRGVRSGKRVMFALSPSHGGIHPVLRWALSTESRTTEPLADAAETPTASTPADHEAGWISDQPAEPPARVGLEAEPTSNRELEDFLL